VLLEIVGRHLHGASVASGRGLDRRAIPQMGEVRPDASCSKVGPLG
jgi:hypothetical protein